MIVYNIKFYKPQEIGCGDEQSIRQRQENHGGKKLISVAHLEDRVDGDGGSNGAD